MKRVTIICDQCKTEITTNHPYAYRYFELVEHTPISRSTDVLVHHFCSEKCISEYYEEKKNG